MSKAKVWIKTLLRTVGLEEAARTIWDSRPDLRVSCWNLGYRIGGAADGLPIPPTRLIHLAILSREVAWFLRSGRFGHQGVLHVLHRNELRPESFGSILDFGCGCGRMIRHWRGLQGPQLYGTDYNPELVAWCRKKLGSLAEFGVNQLRPPLDYGDETFGFVYAISVFTHLTEEVQNAWMNELARVLKPGGYLLITLHGETRLHQLDPQEKERFRAGQLVVKRDVAVGTNACGTYHPEQYVRDHLAKGFRLVDYVPRGSRDTDQDMLLLQRPPRGSRAGPAAVGE